MDVAKFGSERFYVNSKNGIYTPSDLSFEYGKTIVTESRTGKKPISYMGDVNLIKSGFKIRLDNRFVNIRGKINIWQRMAESRELCAFTLGGMLVSSNKFVVTSVKVSNIRTNKAGVMTSADLDISIEEYAGSQKKELNTKPLEEYE